MIKIVIAPDKFKGSLSGMEFCRIVEESILQNLKSAEVIKIPLTDGGDGMIDTVQQFMEGEIIEKEVNDPFMRPGRACYFISEDRETAFIEMAEASGLRKLLREEYNPMKASSYGTGELIADALDRGVKKIVLGIGGSATNDAGMGMARALGYKFYSGEGIELTGTGADLLHLRIIDGSGADSRIEEVVFTVACDVVNPLYGKNGAAFVYAPQKGAGKEVVLVLDRGLRNFRFQTRSLQSRELHNVPGAGAAGGLGYGCMLFLNASLCSGIGIMKGITGFDRKIETADWIITGEGKLDDQTESGKVIRGILDSVSHQKLAVFCGLNTLSKEQSDKYPFHYIDELSLRADNLSDSMENAGKYLKEACNEFVRKVLLASEDQY